MKPKSKILIIAGSDSSGGAGIQADIKTVTALGSYAMTAITAITSQNTTGIKSIVSIDAKEISNQIEFTAKDIKPDAIKIGMLHSASVINAVVKSLNKIKIKKIILDPVMMAKGGTKLINSKAIETLEAQLAHRLAVLEGGGAFTHVVHEIFMLNDLDGDGCITREEWLGSDSVFDALDHDHDGRLLKEDLFSGLGAALALSKR